MIGSPWVAERRKNAQAEQLEVELVEFEVEDLARTRP